MKVEERCGASRRKQAEVLVVVPSPVPAVSLTLSALRGSNPAGDLGIALGM